MLVYDRADQQRPQVDVPPWRQARRLSQHLVRGALGETWVAYCGSVVAGGGWTFLSNHGHVLVALARDPDARMRDVAAAVGITERAVQQIVRDLVAEGYVVKEKVGRRNRYQVVRSAHFRHQLEANVSLGAFVGLVVAHPDHGPGGGG